MTCSGWTPTGAVAWKRYIWFSWVDSPVVRDGIAYVGSSDAAALYAFDARSGRPFWKADVWDGPGTPAVTDRRVYMDPPLATWSSSRGDHGRRSRVRHTVWRHLAAPSRTRPTD